MLRVPLFIHPNTQALVTRHIVPQCTNSTAYDLLLMPPRYCIAVVGRSGVEKDRAIEHLLNKVGLPFSIVMPVKEDIVQEAATLARNGADIGGVLVIKHADRLVYTQDQESIAFGVQLLKLAREADVTILALCDRIKESQLPHLCAFFDQFEYVSYAGCPDADFRKALARWYLDNWIRIYGKKAKVELVMSDDDYESFALSSTFTSQEQILDFLKNVAFEWHGRIFDPQVQEVKKVGIADLESYMSMARGQPHISPFNCEEIEARFSQACGRGAPKDVEKPVEKMQTTGFTAELIDPKEAKEALKKRRKIE